MLPTCPACGQSVLDDDAAECPFCGASMSGKPGKAKPAPKPKAPKPAAAAPAAAAAKSPKAKPKRDSENPFETAPAQSSAAIQAAPKPMKGRLLKVVCPMCDTPGFIPKKAAGRDVRCANKKCMVPVFKAPAPQKRVVEDTGPQPGGSSVGAILGGVLALGVVGAVLYIMLSPKPVVEKPEEKVVEERLTAEEIAKAAYNKARQSRTVAAAKELTLVELRDEVLETMTSAARKGKDDKPFSRRMTTEAFAAAGQMERAREEAGLIAKPGNSKYYQRAFGFSEMAWACLKSGDAAGATEAAGEAAKSAARLPKFGRTEFDVRISVAAAMAAAGQLDEAVAFVGRSSRDLKDPLTHRSALAAAHAAIAVASEDTGMDQVPAVPVTEWTDPVWVATGLILCAEGKPDLAAEWAAKATSTPALSDALAAIASYAAGMNQQAVVAKVVESAKAGGPTMIARVNAAAAHGYATGKHTSAASTSLTTAEAALAMIPKPTPVVIKSPRELYEYSVPDVEAFELAAKATAEVARAQAEINDGGKDTLWNAMRQTHSFCPAPAFIQARLDEELTAAQLASALNIGEAQARSTLIKFNTKIKALWKTCEVRTDAQSAILRQLASSKLGDAVWALANPDAAKSSFSKELPPDSVLPWQVAAAFLRSGRTEAGQAIVKQLGECNAPEIEAEIQSYLYPGSKAQRVAAVLSPERDTEPARLRAIYDVSRQYASEDVVRAIEFARGLGNPDWRREALRLVGTRAARIGYGRKLVEIVKGLDLESPDETAIYRGLVSGIQLDPEFKP